MHRLIAGLFAASLAATLAACGSSSQTVTGPSTNKCGVTATADTSAFGAGGGSGNITISTNRECQWTAQSATSWVKLGSGSSGQGDGKVPFTVAANTDPAARHGTVTVNDQQVTISEEAAPCQFTVSPLADTVSPAGERRTITVTTSSAQCAWTAKSNIDWLAVESGGQSTGNGTVIYGAQATSGPTRSGSLTVAGQTVAVTQGTGCSVAISPTGQAIGASGGSGSITVTTGAGCTWTATSGVPWITVTSGTTGAGPSSVNFTVAAWNGPARTGTIAVNGEVFTVTQGAGCSFSLSSSSTSVGAGGGAGSVRVISADGCSWSSSSNAAWISITSGGSGSGQGTVQFNVASTTGPARTGTLTIAGQPFTVSQGSGCSIDISPSSQQFSSSAGAGSISVTAGSGCGWSASASQSWVRITGGSSGSGNGTVQFAVDTNTGAARDASINVSGRAFSVHQESGCSIGIAPGSQSFDSGGGAGSITVTAGDGCQWTASASQAWVHFTNGSSGSGNGSVQFSVDANSGSARDATITIGTQTFSIHQNGGCSYSLSAPGATIGNAGGAGSVNVTAGTNCTWATAAPDAWVHITLGASGTGNGTVQFTVDANSGAARTSTVTIAGLPFTISQDAAAPPPCTYSIAPPSVDYPDAAAHAGSFALSASAADCAWTASASAAWIQITSPPSGSGGATINYSITANDGPARAGTISVAGQTFTITQGGGCTIAIAPTSQDVGAAGGNGTITVTTGAACSWSASSAVDWIAITAGASGTGNGSVTFTVAPNSGAERNGTITVGGQAFAVKQLAPGV